MNKVIITSLIGAVIVLFFFSNALAEENADKAPGMFTRENPYKTGIIFNVNSIMLDVESYQGGIGLKRYFRDKWAYRAAFDFGYSNSSNSWLVSIGNTFEYHFITARISPYVGIYFDIGYASYKDESDSENWTKVWRWLCMPSFHAVFLFRLRWAITTRIGQSLLKKAV